MWYRVASNHIRIKLIIRMIFEPKNKDSEDKTQMKDKPLFFKYA
jgi:hypothetical protein